MGIVYRVWYQDDSGDTCHVRVPLDGLLAFMADHNGDVERVEIIDENTNELMRGDAA